MLLTFKPELWNIWSVFPLRLAPWKPSKLSLAFTYLFRNYLLRFHVVSSAGKDSRDSSHETLRLFSLVLLSLILQPKFLPGPADSAPAGILSSIPVSMPGSGSWHLSDCHNRLLIGVSSATVTALKCGRSLPHQSEPQTQLCQSSASAPPKLKSFPTPGKEYR